MDSENRPNVGTPQSSNRRATTTTEDTNVSTVQSTRSCRTTSGRDTKPGAPPGTIEGDVRETISDVGPTTDSLALGHRDEKVNAFAKKLVEGWEAYMNDDTDPFPQLNQNLERLQALSLCGDANLRIVLPRLKQGSTGAGHELSDHPLAPSPGLRHTHSSPLQRGSSIFDEQDDGDQVPPAVPLDPFQRSSSTPSAFRQHSSSSAFGTVRSAFRLPSERSPYISGTTASSEPGVQRYSAFDPVKYYARALLEDMERTSIEVQDVSAGQEGISNEEAVTPKRGAATRAARFLSDVRVLRRRRRFLGGRENPARPSPEGSDSKRSTDGTEEEGGSSPPLDTAVTVITESDFNPNDTSLLSRSSEISAIVKQAAVDVSSDRAETCRPSSPVARLIDNDGKEDEIPISRQYQELNSDVEEEEVQYQRIEAQLQTESPGTVPSPSYQSFVDDRPTDESCRPPTNAKSSTKSAMRVKVSGSMKPRFTMGSHSPSPTRIERIEGTILTPRSSESSTASPGTARSSVTGSSSGHTTQATSSSSSAQQSGLSTISETDREVMEANKEAKRRRGLDSLPTTRKNPDGEATSVHSSSTNSTNPHRYLSLSNSPVALREGANVEGDRFFINSGSGVTLNAAAHNVRTQSASTSSTRRSGTTNSPVTSESLSATNTSSSSSSREEPPTFVSYFERQASSDLTSLREAVETSSSRAGSDDPEQREGSPAQLVSYPEVFFEELKSRESPSLRIARQDRIRSLPPRSPVKGARPLKTPPPRGAISPLYHQQLSPPRDIVDHPDSDLSRPYVMRSGVSSSPPFVSSTSVAEVSPDSAEVPVTKTTFMGSEIPVKGRTYEESCIEIMKTSSKEEMMPALVTPEKEAKESGN